jgi:hypothetical protein
MKDHLCCVLYIDVLSKIQLEKSCFIENSTRKNHNSTRKIVLTFQVQRDLQEHFSSLVNLVFEDKDGSDVTVKSDLGWQSLVKFVQVKRWTVSWPPPPQSLTFFMTGRLDE